MLINTLLSFFASKVASSNLNKINNNSNLRTNNEIQTDTESETMYESGAALSSEEENVTQIRKELDVARIGKKRKIVDTSFTVVNESTVLSAASFIKCEGFKCSLNENLFILFPFQMIHFKDLPFVIENKNFHSISCNKNDYKLNNKGSQTNVDC